MTIEPRIGSTVLHFDSVSSTNDLAKDLAATGASEGLCVIAAEQTAGKGRQGRNWSSPSGEGLYLSVILRPKVPPPAASFITLASAIAVAETLRIDFNINADIKWPNDVLVAGKKICGILIESAIENEHLEYIVLGIGVNLLQRAFPEDMDTSATSVWLHTGTKVLPRAFAEALFPRLEHRYIGALSDPTSTISRWLDLSPSARNCPVRVESGEGTIEGVTQGLSAAGALIVELSTGERREVFAGNVRMRSTNTRG